MTLVVAHRGASAQAPENTLEAFRLAHEAGADAIELDVHLTADGQLAVIHDETLDRTTDRTGAVAALRMAEIRLADAGAGFVGEGGAYRHRGLGLTVPTLPEVLAWLPGDMGIVIEIKARAAADAVVDAIRGRPIAGGRLLWRVTSFDRAAIDRVRELDPDLRTGYIVAPGDSIVSALGWAREHGHVAVHAWEEDLGANPMSILGLARAYGRELACYVVNDPARMQVLAGIGLWGLASDVPDVARGIIPREATPIA